MSFSGPKYNEFTSGMSRKAAILTLCGFFLSLVLGEVFFRIVQPSYTRSAGCAMDGIRTLAVLALTDPGPKVLAVGDSTFLGAGVLDEKRTAAGLLRKSLPANLDFYNLCLPGGDCSTSGLVLDALKTEGIRNVDRVIIQTCPGKLLARENVTDPHRTDAAVAELERFLPALRPQALGLNEPTSSFSQKVERRLEFELCKYSQLYRNRDFFRVNIYGTSTFFWLAGQLTSRELRAKLIPSKAYGTNRLAAHLDDYPYAPQRPFEELGLVQFARHHEGDYLEETVKLAKLIGKNPPIILSMPTHYEGHSHTEAQIENYLLEQQRTYDYLRKVARDNQCDVVIADSKDFQNPDLWTATEAHLNAKGQEYLWEVVKRSLLKCFQQSATIQNTKPLP